MNQTLNLPEPLFPSLAQSNDMPSQSSSRMFYYRRSPDMPQRAVQCKTRQWTAPSGEEFSIHLTFDCPECNYPLVVALSNFVLAEGDFPAFTLRVKLVCPAHWRKVDEQGLLLDGHARCGWQAVVRDGMAHATSCTAANLNTEKSCDCGSLGRK